MRKRDLRLRDRRLVLSLETLRLISGAGGEQLGPEPTHSSTASVCTATKFGCCG